MTRNAAGDVSPRLTVDDEAQARPTPVGSYRSVLQGLVTCPDFRLLSPTARQVLLTLKVCPENTSALNLFMYYREVLMAHTQLSAEALDAALVELEHCPAREGPWLYRDPQVLWLAHPRLREAYAASDSLKRNPNQLKRLTRLLRDLPVESPTVQKFLQLSDFAKTLHKGLLPSSSSSSSSSNSSSGTPSPEPPSVAVAGKDSSIGPSPLGAEVTAQMDRIKRQVEQNARKREASDP